MKYLSTINMTSQEIKSQLKYIAIATGARQDFEVEKWNSGFFLELELDNRYEIFFVTAKQTIFNNENDYVYKSMVWKLHTINVLSREISLETKEFDIDLSKNRMFIHDDYMVFHCTNYLKQINDQLFNSQEVLYFIAINAVNLVPNPKTFKNIVQMFDLDLFEQVYMVGYLSHKFEVLTTNLVSKKAEIASNFEEKINEQEIVLLDSGLTQMSYGSLSFKFHNELGFVVLGLLVDYESLEIKIDDKTIELPNGYSKILKGYALMDFIFNKVL